MDDWKQSAVMFYVVCVVLTQVAFCGCIVYHLNNNAERRRTCQRRLCFCCIKDPMVAYDSVEEGGSEEDQLIKEETVFEIDDSAI